MQTVLEGFFRHVTARPRDCCWQYKDSRTRAWRGMTWGEAGACVMALVKWLTARGLNPGDRVALMSSTRVEWTCWDLAILSAGGVTVPIYPSLPVGQAAFILNEPQCRLLIIEREFQPGLLGECERACPQLEGIVLLEGEAHTTTVPVWKHGDLVMPVGGDDVAAAGSMPPRSRAAGAVRGEALASSLRSRSGCFGGVGLPGRAAHDVGGAGAMPPRMIVRPETLATIVYTSGTTGPPKGVELTHANFVAEVEGLQEVFPFPTDYVGLMFLPLAHIVARALQMFQICQGCVSAYAESLETVAADLVAVRPHFFAAVPRVYEKTYQRVQEQLARSAQWRRAFFQWALGVGKRVGRARRLDQPIPWRLRVAYGIAGIAFRPLKEKMGGRLVCAISGGAPLNPELAKFFYAAGILILEGYGLTETTAAVTINRRDDFHLGTVGRPLKGVMVRVAEDGEILVRGGVVTRGYYRRPDETAALLDHAGWFKTGDVGTFSREGFLRITDRKKDLIKTSGGKYIAPQPIEAVLKTSPYIGDVVLYGDRQKFLTALITLNREAVAEYTKAQGIPFAEWRALAAHPQIQALIQQVVDGANDHLASFETIKRFTILDHDFTLEGGELTPTMKVKRQVAYERYKDVFEKMYRE